MAALRLYKFSESFIEFWFCGDAGIWAGACKGKVGELGRQYTHLNGLFLSGGFKLRREFKSLKKQGFVEVPEDKFETLFVRFDASKAVEVPEGEPTDLSDRLYDVLFWSGCAIDSNATNDGGITQMDFKVVDIAIAKKCLKDEFLYVGFSVDDYRIWNVGDQK